MERRIDNDQSMQIRYPKELDDNLDYVLILENQFDIDSKYLIIDKQSIETRKELIVVRQIEIGRDGQNNPRLISLISVG
jgi:hypothetical protein